MDETGVGWRDTTSVLGLREFVWARVVIWWLEEVAGRKYVGAFWYVLEADDATVGGHVLCGGDIVVDEWGTGRTRVGREDEEGESANEWSKGEAADMGDSLEIDCREVKDEGGELSLEQENLL